MAMKTDITEIKVSIGKIEQHLKSINGKLLEHQNFIDNTCPLRHENLRTAVDKNRIDLTKSAAIILTIQTIVIGVAVYFVTNILM